MVHLLVSVQLVSHRSEETGPILPHRLYNVAFPPHHSLEPEVLLQPLGLRQCLSHMAVLVLTVVTLLLLLLPGWRVHPAAGGDGASARGQGVARGRPGPGGAGGHR